MTITHRKVGASSQRPTTMMVHQQIEKLLYWLGPCTLKNTWTMRHEGGRTVVHVSRRQHFKHVVRKALSNGFPINIITNSVFTLYWPICASCGHNGLAHETEPPHKCLFGAHHYMDSTPPPPPAG